MRKEIEKAIDRINEDDLYTIFDIVKARFFFWRTSRHSVMKIIRADAKEKNILKMTAIVKGNKHNWSYYIKGKNLVRFLKMMDKGKVFIDPSLNYLPKK